MIHHLVTFDGHVEAENTLVLQIHVSRHPAHLWKQFPGYTAVAATDSQERDVYAPEIPMPLAITCGNFADKESGLNGKARSMAKQIMGKSSKNSSMANSSPWNGDE